MYTVLPSSSARWRTGSWAESGLDLIVFAAAHASVPRSRSAAASAPVKLEIRLRAPGNRATGASVSAVHTSSRSAAFAASRSASPPRRGRAVSCREPAHVTNPDLTNG